MTLTAPRGDAPRRSLLADRNLWLAFGVTLMVVMGVSSVAPVLPELLKVFGLGPAGPALVVTAFTLPGVFLTPFLGVLADRFGRKAVLVPSLLVFALFGAGCGLARDFHLLLALRLLQGVGAAALGALNVTVISDLFDGRERITALGYNAGVLALGTTVYPALGGLLAHVHWSLPFFLPALALPLALAVGLWLRCPAPVERPGLGQYVREALRLAATGRAAGLFAVTGATFVLLYGLVIAFLPLHLAHAFAAPPWAIGAVIASASLGTGLFSSQLGRLAARIPQAVLLAAGFCLFCAFGTLTPLMPGLAWTVLPVLCFGGGMGLIVPGVQALLAEHAPMEHRGAFMALNGWVLRLSQTLGPVLGAAAHAAWGMDGVFYSGAVLAAAMAGLTVLLAARPGLRPGR
ncbi:MAG: MFS transporter [Thermodesulfobacteriota bacterium]